MENKGKIMKINQEELSGKERTILNKTQAKEGDG